MSKLHTPLFSQLPFCPPATFRKHQRKRPAAVTAIHSARCTTTDVSCQMRAGPTVILYSNIQKGELRKSEEAPVFKVYACQPLSTTGTLTHKGPSRKPVSSKIPNEIPLTLAYPQRNIHYPSCQKHHLCKTLNSCSPECWSANSHSMVLPRKTTRQETKVLEEYSFHACNLTSPILMVALLLRELAGSSKTQQRY